MTSQPPFLPADLLDYAGATPVKLDLAAPSPSRRRGRPRKNSPSQLPTPSLPRVSILVADNWPERVPISERELRIHETHLAEVLDILLGPLP